MNFAFQLRLDLNGIERSHYAYCLWHAAREAKRLKIKRISAIEFGVAQGNGLIILEKIAEQITKLTSVKIDIYGFDLGEGLPQPKDYRDLSFIWQKGFFKMNKKMLKEKLKRTTLILGDVEKTVPPLIKKSIAPIGFIAFDLDYYSSTVSALKIFEASNNMLLPRIFCYFDDIIGGEEELYSEYTGELLAIKEFNDNHKYKKLDVIHGLVHKRAIKNDPWYDQIYILHNFRHPKYNDYVFSLKNRQ